jgi:hypothetical protein
MSIGEVCPKESEEPPQAQDQPSYSIQASPPTQDKEMAQEEEDEGQDDEPPQEDIDQGEMKIMKTRKMIKRFKIKDHHTGESTKQFKEITPVNSILSDIHKGANTRSRVAHFCEHHSFVSSIEPYRIDDALRDPYWEVAMQDELTTSRGMRYGI